ncbi:hypothetical protein BCR37DRAFT_395669 [Protomyces lactucae-debilis]|uniref:Uncharacterized protein n=1 Tax=Protomyces lactucae-debilis TaxID=2754530 RepID=A0A1Y2ETD3_PROLT|nr:uncharacterized protein BCR37DRAFT_395669 [Protomyces lactucae-debilis]ORY74820.1 hypothetical protein BCR37DRAFT_395669 [Protomyces lactucae-debilis]
MSGIDAQIARIMEHARLEASAAVNRILDAKLAQMQQQEEDTVDSALSLRLAQLEEAQKILHEQVQVPVEEACRRFTETVSALLQRKEDNLQQRARLKEAMQSKRDSAQRPDGPLVSAEGKLQASLEDATRAALALYGRRCDKVERDLAVTRKKALISRF